MPFGFEDFAKFLCDPGRCNLLSGWLDLAYTPALGWTLAWPILFLTLPFTTVRFSDLQPLFMF